MVTQANDLLFGDRKEIEMLPLLRTLPHPNAKDLNKQTAKYATLDYRDEKGTVFVELKSRRIPHDKHPTAIVGWNKIRDADWKTGKGATVFFTWSYSDGVYYLRYDPTLFDTFQHDKDYHRGERSDCLNGGQHIVYIPHNHLSKLESKMPSSSRSGSGSESN
jgi:hypothetical protein